MVQPTVCVTRQTERESQWKQRKGKPGGDMMKGWARREVRQDGGGRVLYTVSSMGSFWDCREEEYTE